MSPSNGISQRATWAKGQPISQLMQLALENPQLISLAAGFVDQATLPVEPTREALDALLSDGAAARAALQYGTTAGYPPLRELLLQGLQQADGVQPGEWNVSVDQVVVTAGSNELLHVIADTLFDPGDIVICAAPSYFVFLGMVANLGVRSVGVAVDENGILPDALDETFRRLEAAGELPRVKAVYITTYFDNPSSVTLSADRRPKIVELVRRWSKHHHLYLLEDAAYRELRYHGDDLPSMRAFDPDGETVVVTQTFSKSYSPGIRVGWGLLPKRLLDPVLDQKGNIDFGSPNFAQHIMYTVLKRGLFEPHVQRLRAAYDEKLQAMLQSADEFLGHIPGVSWIKPTGGLYVWLTLPADIDTSPGAPLLKRAQELGVLYVPGVYCYPTEGEPAHRNTIRLSFGVQSPNRIRQGMQLLGQAIEDVLSAAAR